MSISPGVSAHIILMEAFGLSEALPGVTSQPNKATRKHKQCIINNGRVKQEVNKFKDWTRNNCKIFLKARSSLEVHLFCFSLTHKYAAGLHLYLKRQIFEASITATTRKKWLARWPTEQEAKKLGRSIRTWVSSRQFTWKAIRQVT